MNLVLAKLKTLFDTALSAKFTEIYQNEVLIVPQSYLPALMVFPISTKVVAKSTAKDQYVYTIGIRAIVDIKKYVTENGTADKIKAMEAIVNLMEERNADGTLVAATVLGVLRANIRAEEFLFNNDIDIRYSAVREGEWFYQKAEITLTATTDLLTRP